MTVVFIHNNKIHEQRVRSVLVIHFLGEPQVLAVVPADHHALDLVLLLVPHPLTVQTLLFRLQLIQFLFRFHMIPIPKILL